MVTGGRRTNEVQAFVCFFSTTPLDWYFRDSALPAMLSTGKQFSAKGYVNRLVGIQLVILESEEVRILVKKFPFSLQ